MEQQHDITIEQYSGARRIWVDGEDITNEVVGVEMSMYDGQPVAVMLMAKPDSIIIHEKAFIYVQSAINSKVLDDLVPQEIEALAMDREQWGSEKTLVENIVDVIKEKLQGGQADQPLAHSEVR